MKIGLVLEGGGMRGLYTRAAPCRISPASADAATVSILDI